MRTFPPFFLLLALAANIAGCDEEPRKQIDPEAANVKLELLDVQYKNIDGRHTYSHSRKYSESSGTGATLKIGKVCVEMGKTCVSARINYRINGGKSLLQTDHHVSTHLANDTITIEYWGVDDIGKDVQISKTLKVSGTDYKIE